MAKSGEAERTGLKHAEQDAKSNELAKVGDKAHAGHRDAPSNGEETDPAAWPEPLEEHVGWDCGGEKVQPRRSAPRAPRSDCKLEVSLSKATYVLKKTSEAMLYCKELRPSSFSRPLSFATPTDQS